MERRTHAMNADDTRNKLPLFTMLVSGLMVPIEWAAWDDTVMNTLKQKSPEDGADTALLIWPGIEPNEPIQRNAFLRVRLDGLRRQELSVGTDYRAFREVGMVWATLQKRLNRISVLIMRMPLFVSRHH